jgi:hypothetical protein
MHARLRDGLQQIRESQTILSVPAELVDPHPLVRAAGARLKRREGWDHPAGVRSAPKEVLNLQVTRNTLDRALRLIDTLLKALKPSGITARVDEEKGQTLLVGGGTTLTTSIVEQITRTSHTPTRAEVRARDRYYDSFRSGARGEYPDIPQFDWHPTGRLTLTVGSWPSRKWNDTERSLIDARLSGIVAAIVGLAEAKRAKEEEEERRRRTYEEARARHEAQVRALNEERRQLRALVRDASRLQRAQRMREFIAAVEDRARQDGALTPEKHQWIEWARAKADWLDPLVRRSDPILDAPEPEAPNYWQY